MVEVIYFRKTRTTFYIADTRLSVKTNLQNFAIKPRTRINSRDYLAMIESLRARKVKSIPQLINKYNQCAQIHHSSDRWYL